MDTQTKTISMTQSYKIRKVEKPSNENKFISQRAMIQYIGVNTRPEIFSSTQLLAP